MPTLKREQPNTERSAENRLEKRASACSVAGDAMPMTTPAGPNQQKHRVSRGLARMLGLAAWVCAGCRAWDAYQTAWRRHGG